MNTLLKPVLFSLLVASALPVWADVSRAEAAAVAQRVASGRVLSVERAERDNQSVWRVKILSPQGEVHVVVVDVASGRIVGG